MLSILCTFQVDFSQSVSKMWNSWRRGDRDMNSKYGSDGQARSGDGRSVGKNLELKSKYDAGHSSHGPPQRKKVRACVCVCKSDELA